VEEGAASERVFDRTFPADVTALLDARAAVHDALAGRVEPSHLDDVQLAIDELVSRLIDAGAHGEVAVEIRLFRLLTSVRVGCTSRCVLTHDAFSLRERILGAITVAFGQREHADGTVDLWAEIWRPEPAGGGASAGRI
jgi:hypothetical protein